MLACHRIDSRLQFSQSQQPDCPNDIKLQSLLAARTVEHGDPPERQNFLKSKRAMSPRRHGRVNEPHVQVSTADSGLV